MQPSRDSNLRPQFETGKALPAVGMLGRRLLSRPQRRLNFFILYRSVSRVIPSSTAARV